jgi:hypothetical protein
MQQEQGDKERLSEARRQSGHNAETKQGSIRTKKVDVLHSLAGVV